MGMEGLFYGAGFFQIVIMVLVLSAVFSAVRSRLTPNQLVMRAYRIDYQPEHASAGVNGHVLSDAMITQMGDDPVYAGIVGRPAGLINFIREMMGIGRRFEFTLSDGQAVMRRGSITSHALKCATVEGLNGISVSQQRLHPLVLFLQFLVVLLLINAPFYYFTYEGAGLGLSLLIFIAFVAYWFICKITVIELTHAHEKVLAFTVYPAMLERLGGQSGLDMPQIEANRLVQLFKWMKDNEDGASAHKVKAPAPRPAPPPATIVAPPPPPPPPPPAARPAAASKKAAAPATLFCSACGTANEPDAKFCGECGTAM